MKTPGYFLLSMIISFAFNGLAQTTSSKNKSKKTLVWRDEFKGKGLPDSTKWGYEEGFIRNRESQYYTRARLENCYIKGGKLILESIKEKYKNAEYTSASINTLGKQQFEGDFRIEIRAKIPSGKGIWPALWMMGSNMKQVGWPKCFEFDIMEFVGKEPNTIHGTFHWWEPDTDQSKQHKSKGSRIMFDDLHKKYHIYGLERRGDTAIVFVDDKVFFTMAAPANAFKDSFTSPVYLLMNTAVGGEWGGLIDDSIFPQKFYIDYVRVFKLE
ncbi:glycoside hydrolase family 16 protein [Pedobacter ginsengisoli]|uniref:glycoside hydrolase family 16 protein n=1 Tax=Pedobacter ginsengisoli TaxID=363852 RepID=UPI00254DFCD2|nr:glycoside hydrolase family 16 protein [Pedobacter ginsengisoli]